MINNVEKIAELLKFDESGDIFYFLQVIKRKKDNPDLKGDIKICSKYVRSLDYFYFLLNNEIIPICELLHARCYISLIPRSIKKLGKLELSIIAERVCTENYARYLDIRDSCALNPKVIQWKGIIPKSRYMLDIDRKQDLDIILSKLTEKKIIPETIIETVLGYHIIVPGICPENIWKDIKKSGSDYTFLDSNVSFTFLTESNTILYFK